MATTQSKSTSRSAALAAAATGAAISPLGTRRRSKSSGTPKPTSLRTLSPSPQNSVKSPSPPKLLRGVSANPPRVMMPPFPLPGSEFGSASKQRYLREVHVGEDFRSCSLSRRVAGTGEVYYDDHDRTPLVPPEQQFSSQRMKDTLATLEAYLQQLKIDIAAGNPAPKSDAASRQLMASMAELRSIVKLLKTLTTDQHIPDRDAKRWEERFWDYRRIFDLSRQLMAALHGLRTCVKETCRRSTTASRRSSSGSSRSIGVSERQSCH